MIRITASLVAAVGLAAAASAQPTLTPITTFGSNGWRAPSVILTGDDANSNNGTTYFGLGNANNERGMAVNPVTGDLILVSREANLSTASRRIRIIDGLTGVDKGSLSEGVGTIAGGTFVMNQVGVADDGTIYVANLAGDVRSTTTPFRIYSWANQSAQPAVHYTGAIGFGTGGTAPRLGDSFDVRGSGANTRIVAGFNGIQGYTLFSGASSPTATVVTGSASPTPPAGSVALSGALAASQYRLGITFAQDADNVWGKVTSANLIRSQITGPTTASTFSASLLTAAGESPIDYTVIGGVPYLAALDINNNRVYIYDVSNPASPTSLFPFGLSAIPSSVTPNANGNGTGSIKWGAIDQLNQTATLYTLGTNNGLQAFSFVVPAPGAAGVLAIGGLLAARRRR